MKRCLLPVALVAAVATLTGSSPVFWQVSTQAELLRGEVDALSVDDEGRLRLGPATDTVLETPEPALWSLARAADGALWMGSGTDGRLYRLGADGTGTVVLDADELDVHALAADREGGVYAGTSPGGRVYRITAAGDATVVFDPEETYIWALALDGDGALYVATGNPARVYRLPAGGAPALLYASDAAHVLSLAVAGDGTLLAGTESPGQVLRIDPTGRAFVLLDSPYEEIRSLRPQPDGSLLAVAVSGQPAPGAAATPAPAPAAAAAPVATVSVTTSVSAVVVGGSATPTTTPASTTSSTSTGEKGAVYHITADGLWDRLWRSSLDTPFDAAFDARGTLVVGTGPNGKLYRVSGDPPRTVLSGQAAARQVTRLLPATDGSLWYATANPGKVLRMAGRLAARGTYRSEVHDAGAAARWGSIRWRGVAPPGSRIELASRSGNTAIPNDTWSAWSDAYTEASGSPIASPNARYLQWRATLHAGGDASPVLTAVTAAYLPRNLRPEVTRLTVHPPGTVFQQSLSTGDPAHRGARRAAVLHARHHRGPRELPQGHPDLPLAGERREPRPARVLGVLPAGRRQRLARPAHGAAGDGVRVGHHDDPRRRLPGAHQRVRRGGERARRGPRRRARQPRLRRRQRPAPHRGGSAAARGRPVVLPFTVRDAQSPVQRVEIAAGNDDWRVVHPLDGVPDGLVERFEVVLDGAGAGPVVIRATDALRNTVSVFGE